jgi:hypothetical protein
MEQRVRATVTAASSPPPAAALPQHVSASRSTGGMGGQIEGPIRGGQPLAWLNAR